MPDKNKLPCVVESGKGFYTEFDVGQTLEAHEDQHRRNIICLNDQGGSVMTVEDSGSAGTLRAQTHGNEQIVCAFMGGQGAKAGGIA